MLKKLVGLFIMLVWISVAVRGQTAEWNIRALWISPGYQESESRPCPIFRKEFNIRKKILSGRLLLTARGVYEANINGRRIGTAYFTPGWTSYDYRIQYQEFDVTKMLKSGDNFLMASVGEGWYRGPFGGLMKRDNYAAEAAFLGQLEIVYKDGTIEQIVSDSTWQCGTGPILHSDIYGGEVYDARLTPGNWSAVKVNDFGLDKLIPTISEPVRKHKLIKPNRIFETPNHEQVIDFGQNMAGWVRIKVKGRAGDTIKLFHAEVLDKAGNFYTGNLREATAVDIYILKGDKEETFEPHFTWHGFRYVKIEGCKATNVDFVAIPLYSDLLPVGTFTCSNQLINKLQQNINWSLKGNFLDIPTDCPQRSERLGWTGDAQVFFRTASFNFNVRSFFTKWLGDLKVDQQEDGAVPNIIPNLYRKFGKRKGVAGWGDAATIIPWQLYWIYRDTAILNAQYASMKAWVDYISGVSKNGLWTANGYGDWYAPGDSTSLPYIDQCFWAHSTDLLIQASMVLGKNDEANQYMALLQRIKKVFLQNYITDDGQPVTNTQTAYILALQFEMLPDSLRPIFAKKLVGLIRANNNHLATGFLGTPYLLHVLSKYGYTDVAYDVLMQESRPSWLYPVKMGATTIWEKWDGIKEDGTVQPTSYNHYSYGAVGEWLYRVAAGIEAAEPGFEKIIIQPHPGGGLKWVKASYQCPFGKIVSSWSVKHGSFVLNVEVPPGTSATIYMPGQAGVEVLPGKHTFKAKASAF